MANTEYRGYPMPDEAAKVNEEFWRLANFTLPLIDIDVQSLFEAVAGKANVVHPHEIADISGLATALQGFMPKSRTFAITDLTDVAGAGEAPAGYVLIKTADGKWLAQSAGAALGTHGHTIEQIQNLASVLGEKANLTSAVLFDRAQGLSLEQKSQAKSNMGVVDTEPGDITANALAPAIAGAANKVAPIDTDLFGLVEVGGLLKRLYWSNLKAALKTFFDTLYAAVGHSHTFAQVTAKPTTLAGYGITDAAPIPASSAYPVGTVLLAMIGVTTLSVVNGGTTAGSNLRILTSFFLKDDNGVVSANIVRPGSTALPGIWRNISGQTISAGVVDNSAYTNGGAWVRVN